MRLLVHVRKRASTRSMFIYCRSEGISIFAVVSVNCDENNIPGCCNGNSYILSASTGFRFLRFLPPLTSPLYLSSYFYLSFSRFGTLGAAFDVCYRAWLNSNWKFTLEAVCWGRQTPLAVYSFCLYPFPRFVFMIYCFMIYWFWIIVVELFDLHM